MSNELNKKMNFAKCQHCGEVTDITLSDAIVKMKTQVIALKEELMEAENRCKIIRRQKVGQVMAMHILIKRLYNLMTSEQRQQARVYSQQLRDEFKKIENRGVDGTYKKEV